MSDLSAHQSVAQPPLAIQSAELDFLTLVEHEVRPPIAFKTLDGLKNWMHEHALERRQVGNRRPENVFVAYGKVSSPAMGELYYTQMWIRVHYTCYRAALKEYVNETEPGRNITVHNHDVDHAVSAKFLKLHWPDSWVNVLFVEHGINRSIGAMMEKVLKAPSGESIELNMEAVLKIFYRRTEKLTRSNIEACFSEAAHRFLSTARSHHDIACVMNATEILNDIGQEFRADFVARRNFIVVAR